MHMAYKQKMEAFEKELMTCVHHTKAQDIKTNMGTTKIVMTKIEVLGRNTVRS